MLQRQPKVSCSVAAFTLKRVPGSCRAIHPMGPSIISSDSLFYQVFKMQFTSPSTASRTTIEYLMKHRDYLHPRARGEDGQLQESRNEMEAKKTPRETMRQTWPSSIQSARSLFANFNAACHVRMNRAEVVVTPRTVEHSAERFPGEEGIGAAAPSLNAIA